MYTHTDRDNDPNLNGCLLTSPNEQPTKHTFFKHKTVIFSIDEFPKSKIPGSIAEQTIQMLRYVLSWVQQYVCVSSMLNDMIICCHSGPFFILMREVTLFVFTQIQCEANI